MTRRLLVGGAVLAAAALGFALFRFNHRDAEALSGQTRADFVRSAVEGCVARQKASPDNAAVEPKTIEAFCGCYAEALATRISNADLDRLSGSSAADMQAAVRPRMEASDAVCLAKLDQTR